MRSGSLQTPPLESQKTHVFLEGFLAPADCERLIGQSRESPEEPGQLIGGETVRSVRRSRVRWLPAGAAFGWIEDRMIGLVAAANRDDFGFDLWGMDERLQFLEYSADEHGGFDWHVDRGRSGFARMRKLSVSVQLSDPDDYEGGALELNPDGLPLAAPRSRGTATVFTSTVLHRVAPVTGGLRVALTAWFHGPHFR